MGVKTEISLRKLNQIFPRYNFLSLMPTSSGIMDTTYIVLSKDKSYILKKYERDISDKIEDDKKLLNELKSFGLNVPVCLDENRGWYLYEKLEGSQPKHIQSFHIQALARFLAVLHLYTYKKSCNSNFIDSYEIDKILDYTRSNFFSYYKKLQFLKKYRSKNDGLIHGDIFKDNTVFNAKKIGVFDFIDAGCGSFAFDAAVALVGFNVKKYKHGFINLFLRAYNQHAPKKLSKEELLTQMQIASSFYALLRIYKYKNTSKIKEIL